MCGISLDLKETRTARCLQLFGVWRTDAAMEVNPSRADDVYLVLSCVTLIDFKEMFGVNKYNASREREVMALRQNL